MYNGRQKCWDSWYWNSILERLGHISPPSPPKQCWFCQFLDCTDHSAFTTLNWGAGGTRELTLHANKIVQQLLNYRKASLPKSVSTTFVAHCSHVRGYHVYKVVWKPRIGEKLQLDQELGNEADKFAMKVVKNNEIVGNLPREYSWTLRYFIARGGKICVKVTGCRHHCKQLCEGMEIPCRSVFSCSSKMFEWKLIAWKNSWRARFADKHAKTQTTPFGANTWKSPQFLFCLFLDNLRSFMNIN